MTIHQNTVATVADDLNELLTETGQHLDEATDNVGYLTRVIRSKRARRLARRRNAAIVADAAAPMLETFDWVLAEALGQLDEVTAALGVLLEPPRSRRTRYGRKHGIYATAPYDWTKCGTPAAYQAHRRRGQDCQVCRKAVARYEADRRRRTSTVGGPVQIRDVSWISL